jgi:hypothetical protein
MNQMINRLELSERIQERDKYFNWKRSQCAPSAQASSDGSGLEGETSDADEEDEPGVDDASGEAVTGAQGNVKPAEIELADEYDNDDHTTFTLPKRLSRLHVTIAQVAYQHGASDLHRQLQLYYLRCSSSPDARHQTVGYELDPLPFMHVDLYRQFRVNLTALPYSSKSKTQLMVKADPQGGQKIRGKPNPYYSAVLVDEHSVGSQPTNGLRG